MPSFSVTTRRAYSAGHFQLNIDGMPSTAYIKSLEGGYAKMNSVDEQLGGDNVRIKHGTSIEVDPITMEVGMSQTDFLLKWIKDSWEKRPARYNGSIVSGDFDYKSQFEQWFYDALIEETAFPTLDASSKDALLLKVKIRPERVEFKKGDDHALSFARTNKQKLWAAAAFRLVIDGVDTRYVNKIDGFAIKQGIKPVAPGPRRFPQLEPTKIDFPDVGFHMSTKHAGEVFAWYEQVVLKGKKDPLGERNGAIEFLDTSRSNVLLRIKLNDVGIKQFTRPKMEANQDAISRCKVDLFVGSMEIEGDIRLGLE